jgi:hypothetical protein
MLASGYCWWWRPCIASALGVSMVTLMIAGYSSQPSLADGIDIGLAGFVVLTLWSYDRFHFEDDKDGRSYPAAPARLRWLGTWAAHAR